MYRHEVHFYDDDETFVAFLGAQFAAPLEHGDHVLGVAGTGHVAGIERRLGERLDVSLARESGRLVLLDAERTLEQITVDGSPDPHLFETHIARRIADAGRGGAPVRAFGEMVALLWDSGNVAGAIALEELWNELFDRERFTLLCAYPTTALDGASLGALRRVCHLHSAVLAPPSYASTAVGQPTTGDHPDVRSDVFVPVPEAVRATRRFVSGVLAAWDLLDLQWDAGVIVSELANNAVCHGASPFRVLVSRAGDGVRIGVQDVGPRRPFPRAAGDLDIDGRGLAIVGALAEAWGCERLAEGKFTWAELGARAPEPT